MSKDKMINFKVEDIVKADFEKICKDNFTTPSHELQLYVRKTIENHSKQKKKKKNDENQSY